MGQDVMDAGRRAAAAAGGTAAEWRSPLARVGLATLGVLYLIVGYLVVEVARGRASPEDANQHGAIERVVQTTSGRWLVLALTVGLFALVAWRVIQFVLGDPVEGNDAKHRAKFAARALVYVALAATALSVLIDNWNRPRNGSGGSNGGGAKEQKAAAWVLDWPAGWLLVILVGLSLIGYGGYQLVHNGVQAKFDKRLATGRMSDATQNGVRTAGRVGYSAKAVVAALVGLFLIVAGATHDPGDAKGISGVVAELAATSWGPPVLWLVATGLVLYGVFCLAEACYRRPS